MHNTYFDERSIVQVLHCGNDNVVYSLEQQLEWHIIRIFSCIHTTNAQLRYSFSGLLPIVSIKVKKNKKEEEEVVIRSLNIDKISLTFLIIKRLAMINYYKK